MSNRAVEGFRPQQGLPIKNNGKKAREWKLKYSFHPQQGLPIKNKEIKKHE